MRYLLGSAVALLPLAAAAQNTTQPPPVTLPGVERFTLPPAGTQPTPAPSPSTTPPPVVPPISVLPSATPTPSATRPTSRPSPQPTRATTPAPAPTPSETPTPTTTETPAVIAPPVAEPSAIPTPEPTPTSVAAPSTMPDWPWLAGGAAAVVAALGAGWALGRRRPQQLLTYQPEVEPEPVAIAPTPPIPRAQPTPPPAPVAAPPEPARPNQQIAVDLMPVLIDVEDAGTSMTFELILTNTGTQSADGVRAVVGMLTAGPDLEPMIAQFHANAAIAAADDPVTLAPGQSHSVRGQIALSREQLHIASAAGRPMMVPVIVANLRWRAGLGIRSGGDAFMVGTGDGATKLGPIWLDRGRQRFSQLTARRFDPDPLKA